MNRPDYCAWPPRLAADVEISLRNDADRPSFIAGSASVGRYLILGTAEHRVLELLDGARIAPALCRELVPTPQLGTLTRFLAKLDEVGILAGKCDKRPMQALLPGNQVYLRWSLFNPDHLFARLLPVLRWIWTPWFFAASVLLLAGTAAMALMNWAEVCRDAGQVLRGHYLLIIFVAWLVTVCHEFAHGLTSKAFGGRATEVGFLLLYYCIPALYSNVSGLHLIPGRRQRLWVIAAGVYWQLLVGASALAGWFVLNPDTLPGRLAMVFVLASLMEVVFNANPLIKLDGYYFLSQWNAELDGPVARVSARRDGAVLPAGTAHSAGFWTAFVLIQFGAAGRDCVVRGRLSDGPVLLPGIAAEHSAGTDLCLAALEKDGGGER